jgi:hypothetical protein
MTTTIRSGRQIVTPLLDLKGRKLIAVEKVDINSERAPGIQKKLGLSATAGDH